MKGFKKLTIFFSQKTLNLILPFKKIITLIPDTAADIKLLPDVFNLLYNQ